MADAIGYDTVDKASRLFDTEWDDPHIELETKLTGAQARFCESKDLIATNTIACQGIVSLWKKPNTAAAAGHHDQHAYCTQPNGRV